ncbi:unnamed protein product, partial [Rotaria sordida]
NGDEKRIRDVYDAFSELELAAKSYSIGRYASKSDDITALNL